MYYRKIRHYHTKFMGIAFLLLLIIGAAAAVSNPAIVNAAEKDLKAAVRDGDALMAKRSLDSYEKALAKYRAALSQEPDNTDYMLKTSQALICMMRVMTNGNTVKIDGTTQDDEKNKAVWAKYGPEAVKLAEAVKNKRSDDPVAQNAYAESYMYYSSSFGIIQAIFKGAATQYKENARMLIKIAPKLDDAIGDIYMGAFYIAAPWPLSDIGEAEKHIKKAVELCPDSVRAHHYTAIIAIKKKNYDVAKKELDVVLNSECTTGPEHDYCGWLKGQAEKGLAIVAEKTK